MSTAPFKQLPLDVAAKDGRARRTIIAAIESTALNWSKAESSVNHLIRENTGLRSTERRFVGEAVWGVVRRYQPYGKLADTLLPDADSYRRTLMRYFLYLVLDREADAEVVRPHLEQAGLPADVETWRERRDAYAASLGDEERFAFDHGMPLWFVRKIREQYGDEAAALAEALNRRAPVDLRVNVARIDVETARDHIRFEGVKAVPTPYSPWGLRIEGHVNVHAVPMFRKGLVDIQDEGSQLLALLTGAQAGETVVDMCAGGGGKLAALAAIAADKKLVAMDVDKRRLRDAEKRLGRLQLPSVEMLVLPKAGPSPLLVARQSSCDRVLVDAPCSGTGAWRRHPADRWRLQEREIDRLVESQRKILADASALVKTGGRLVYATCSLLREENEEQVAWFTEQHPEFRLVPAVDVLPSLPAEVFGDAGRFMRTLPHVTGTDGFFAAVFSRVKNQSA